MFIPKNYFFVHKYEQSVRILIQKSWTVDGETYYFNEQTTPPTLMNLIYETTGPSLEELDTTAGSLQTTLPPLIATTDSILDELASTPNPTTMPSLVLETTESLLPVFTTAQSETTESELLFTTAASDLTTFVEIQNTTQLLEQTTQSLDLTTLGLDLTTMGIDLSTVDSAEFSATTIAQIQNLLNSTAVETTQVIEKTEDNTTQMADTSTTTTTSTTTKETTTTTEANNNGRV